MEVRRRRGGLAARLTDRDRPLPDAAAYDPHDVDRAIDIDEHRVDLVMQRDRRPGRATIDQRDRYGGGPRSRRGCLHDIDGAVAGNEHGRHLD